MCLIDESRGGDTSWQPVGALLLLVYIPRFALHCMGCHAVAPTPTGVSAAGPYAATDAPTGLAVRCALCACAAVTRACRRPPGEWEEQAGRKARDDLLCIDRRSTIARLDVGTLPYLGAA